MFHGLSCSALCHLFCNHRDGEEKAGYSLSFKCIIFVNTLLLFFVALGLVCRV